MRTAIAALAMLLLAVSCKNGEKHEPAQTTAAQPPKTRAPRNPAAEKLSAQWPRAKSDMAACTDAPCRESVQRRVVSMASDALVEHRISTSLPDVEQGLAKWRHGDLTSLAAHDFVLRYDERVQVTMDRLLTATKEQPLGILRDAVDAKLLPLEAFVVLAGKQPAEVPPTDALTEVEEPTSDDKRTTLEKMLEHGPVLVHLDARRAGVKVLPRLQSDSALVLRIGRDLSPPIADLVIDDQGISASLQFDGKPFRCVLPWTAIYGAMPEGAKRGTVWPDDVPDDVVTPATPR